MKGGGHIQKTKSVVHRLCKRLCSQLKPLGFPSFRQVPRNIIANNGTGIPYCFKIRESWFSESQYAPRGPRPPRTPPPFQSCVLLTRGSEDEIVILVVS